MSLQAKFPQNTKKCSSKGDKYLNQQSQYKTMKYNWKNKDCLNRKIEDKNMSFQMFRDYARREFKLKFYVTPMGKTSTPSTKGSFFNNYLYGKMK